MKWPNVVFVCSIGNALFFFWVYLTHLYKIDWVIAGVFHELLILPMILLVPLLFTASAILLFKKENRMLSAASFLITAAVTGVILWLFYRDLS